MVIQIMKLRRQLRILKLELWLDLATLINKIVHRLNNLSQVMVNMGDSMIYEIEKDDVTFNKLTKEDATDESA